jgi:chromosome segregation ATPase
MTSRDVERTAIRAAIDRLLTGSATHSTGALTVLQLAEEAGVKRWVLTHKHPDLKEEFERRRTESNGIPRAFQHLQARVTDLEAANQRLRQANTELTTRVELYSQVIHALSTEREQHQCSTHDQRSNVRALPRSAQH